MESTRCILGLDPGAGGGIAVLIDGQPPQTFKMPEADRDLYELLSQFAPSEFAVGSLVVAFCEKVHSSPQMGVVSAFKFGQSVGKLRMALVAAGIRLEMVTPQKWQKHFGLIVKGRGMGQRDTDKKNRNKARAQELFPGVKVTHAIADALLIADYGRAVWQKLEIA